MKPATLPKSVRIRQRCLAWILARRTFTRPILPATPCWTLARLDDTPQAIENGFTRQVCA
jgi:hypothetical protein